MREDGEMMQDNKLSSMQTHSTLISLNNIPSKGSWQWGWEVPNQFCFLFESPIWTYLGFPYNVRPLSPSNFGFGAPASKFKITRNCMWLPLTKKKHSPKTTQVDITDSSFFLHPKDRLKTKIIKIFRKINLFYILFY